MAAASSLARGSVFRRWISPTRPSPAAASLLSRSRPSSRMRPQPLRSASTARPTPPPPPPPRLPILSSRRALALSTMLPVHSAVASARLVASLPREAGAVVLEGRFANYVSPI